MLQIGILFKHTLHTSNGFRLKYVDPGLCNLSICCFDVNTESTCSIAFTYI